MKIAISTSIIQRGKSGVGQYVLALVRALLEQDHGHDIHLLVLEEDLPLFEFARGRMKLIPVSEKWRPAVRNIFWHQVVLRRWLKREAIDVLHVPSYRRMVWRAPCATVATIHDLAPFHVKGKYDLARMIYGRVIVKQLARCQDRIVAVSSHTASDISRFFSVPADRMKVVLNGLDHDRFRPAESSRALPGASSAPYFLYISRLEHPAKNHVRLIEAFTRFKAATGSDWQLVLGGSDWHGADRIHAAAAASPYAEDILFPGFVPDSDLPGLYRAAGAMVYPSMFEGFGMPPVEAMACGCPVISSDAGSLAEVVGDAAWIIDPQSIESIQAALETISSDASRRRLLIEAGYANARRFSWQANAETLLDIYREVSANPPLGGMVPAGRMGEGAPVTSHRHVPTSSPLQSQSAAV